ncbi:GIY-YIG nuclease family protein [Candidatus Dojkabacteria bacterium]|nr:GIY-YIG nuclease family protein [Candidatus Dojkabacteria bacterium]
MSGFVYLLENEFGERYVGSTTNLKRRTEEHNSKRSNYTKRSSQWRLIYYERFDTIEQARKYELEIKRSRFKRDKFYQKAECSSVG